MSLFSRVVCLMVLASTATEANEQAPLPQAPAAPGVPQVPAQPVPVRRPYRGIFQGGDPGQADGLSARFTLAGGYDDNVVADEQGSISDQDSPAGSFGSGAAQLVFNKRQDRVTYRLEGSSELRYYNAASSWQQSSYSGLGSLEARVGRQGTFMLRQSARYSPYYQFELLADLPSVDNPAVSEATSTITDRNVAAMNSQAYYTDAAFTHGVGRGSLSYRYGYHTSKFEDDALESSGHSAGVGYSRRVGRYATLRLGYGYQTVLRDDAAGAESTLHDLDIGGGYSRPLSFSRRTTLGISGGTVMSDSRGARRYRVTGDGTIHHEIGRTWLVRGAYRQGMQVVSAFPEPVYGYTARGTIRGLVTRALDLYIDGGYSSGNYASTQDANAYSSTFASARLRRAFGRWTAAYVEYSYYEYSVDNPVLDGVITNEDFQRHGVRAGLTLWVPLLSERQTHVAR